MPHRATAARIQHVRLHHAVVINKKIPIIAGSGECETIQRDHRHMLRALQRMLNADPPRLPRRIDPASVQLAANLHQKITGARRRQDTRDRVHAITLGNRAQIQLQQRRVLAHKPHPRLLCQLKQRHAARARGDGIGRRRTVATRLRAEAPEIDQAAQTHIQPALRDAVQINRGAQHRGKIRWQQKPAVIAQLIELADG